MKNLMKILSKIFGARKSDSDFTEGDILPTKELLGVPLSGWARSNFGDFYQGRAQPELGPGFGGRKGKRSA